jgi:hypothetical protein
LHQLFYTSQYNINRIRSERNGIGALINFHAVENEVKNYSGTAAAGVGW